MENQIGGGEYRLQHKNGDWRWFESRSSVLRDKDGNVSEIIGIATTSPK